MVLLDPFIHQKEIKSSSYLENISNKQKTWQVNLLKGQNRYFISLQLNGQDFRLAGFSKKLTFWVQIKKNYDALWDLVN